MTDLCRKSPLGARLNRREALRLAVATGVGLLGVAGVALAEDTQVPPELQAQLLSKVTTYWRDFAARAGERARVVVLVRSGNLPSMRAAGFIKSALSQLSSIGGIAHEVEAVNFD